MSTSAVFLPSHLILWLLASPLAAVHSRQPFNQHRCRTCYSRATWNPISLQVFCTYPAPISSRWLAAHLLPSQPPSTIYHSSTTTSHCGACTSLGAWTCTQPCCHSYTVPASSTIHHCHSLCFPQTGSGYAFNATQVPAAAAHHNLCTAISP
jgi:hypothetical protein